MSTTPTAGSGKIDFSKSRSGSNRSGPAPQLMAALEPGGNRRHLTSPRSRVSIDQYGTASRESCSESEEQAKLKKSRSGARSSRKEEPLLPIKSMSAPSRRRMPQKLDKLVESTMDKSEITEEFMDQLRTHKILTYINEEDKKMIYGGNLQNIVLQLLDWLLTEANRKDIFRLVRIFITCYRKFFEPWDLLEILINLWHSEIPPDENENEYKARTWSGVMLFLSEWIDAQYSDFSDPATFNELEAFVAEMPSNIRKPIISKIQNSMKPKVKDTFCLFEPTKDLKLVPGRFDLSDLKPNQIADQWTLLDFKNFSQIQRSDFLSSTPSEHWNLMIKRSSVFTLWVASEIVQNLNITKRIEVIKKMVQIGMRFLENGNFNGLMCTWGGLNSVYVHRLKKTRKKMPKQISEIWKSLDTKLSEEGNFRYLRNAMEKLVKSKEPMVPWFELVKKMRERLDEYEDFLLESEPKPSEKQEKSEVTEKNEKSEKQTQDQRVINFAKIFLIGEQILNFEEIQENNSCLNLENPQDSQADILIRNFLEHLPTYDHEVLWKFSHQCESGKKEKEGK
eukprot:TRINITY_DN6844_c0_g1_i2.p1 TRINITY_DN6844_c0_g1~~TRINITY_DN6844_c0_g1_i2.p1  ORF type:complete len:564 (+),score=83.30 TRINITY_DN6844_c0_g1_i2:244-1935(+)